MLAFDRLEESSHATRDELVLDYLSTTEHMRTITDVSQVLSRVVDELVENLRLLKLIIRQGLTRSHDARKATDHPALHSPSGVMLSAA
jgi:predicted RecB family endonuclease